MIGIPITLLKGKKDFFYWIYPNFPDRLSYYRTGIPDLVSSAYSIWELESGGLVKNDLFILYSSYYIHRI